MKLVIKDVERERLSDEELKILEEAKDVILEFQGHLINLLVDNKALAEAILSLIVAQAKLFKTV